MVGASRVTATRSVAVATRGSPSAAVPLTVTVLVNHEIGATNGTERAHGAIGAFVSELVIDTATLEVVQAGDLGHRMFLWNTGTDSHEELAPAIARLCSADLPPVSAFYDAETGLGTAARILLNGEEVTPEGRAFAWVATGPEQHRVFELPVFGNVALEPRSTRA